MPKIFFWLTSLPCCVIFFIAYPVPFFRLPCCALFCLFPYEYEYPTEPFFVRLPCCAFFFAHLLCHLFFVYPAMPYFYRLPCRAAFFFLLTLLCPYFSSHLPCCALPRCAAIFLRTYPAGLTLLVLPCWSYPAVILFFYALTLLCPHFTFTYPAGPLFFFALNLLRHLCDSRLPYCALFFFTLTLLCPYFSSRLDYPTVPLFFFMLTLLCFIFLRTYPAVLTLLYSVPLFFYALTLLCPYVISVSH